MFGIVGRNKNSFQFILHNLGAIFTSLLWAKQQIDFVRIASDICQGSILRKHCKMISSKNARGIICEIHKSRLVHIAKVCQGVGLEGSPNFTSVRSNSEGFPLDRLESLSMSPVAVKQSRKHAQSAKGTPGAQEQACHGNL